MHIGVEKGAAPNQGFAAYVDHLVTANIVPPHFKPWVDHIRKKSNEANHQIVLMDRKDAQDIISFTEMLLRILYEYPGIAAAAGS